MPRTTNFNKLRRKRKRTSSSSSTDSNSGNEKWRRNYELVREIIQNSQNSPQSEDEASAESVSEHDSVNEAHFLRESPHTVQKNLNNSPEDSDSSATSFSTDGNSNSPFKYNVSSETNESLETVGDDDENYDDNWELHVREDMMDELSEDDEVYRPIEIEIAEDIPLKQHPLKDLLDMYCYDSNTESSHTPLYIYMY
ncbi:hypothetical protein TKK_0010461 [Trichogramma kaykai]